MNKRIKKKIERRHRQIIHQMLDLVLDINGLCAREQEITGNAPTAFFDFSGHIARVEANIHKRGWDTGKIADATYGFYTDRESPIFADGRKEVMKLRETRDMLLRKWGGA